MAKKLDFDMATPEGPDATLVTWWTQEIADAVKREADWIKSAREVQQIYESEKKTACDFNILYANTETLLPALYSNCPVPVVKRRYSDKDPVGKIASMVLKRALQYEQDSNLGDSYTFDDSMEAAVMDGLIPGRGLTRFKIDSKDGKAYVCREAVHWERFHHGYGRSWTQVPWVSFDHFLTREEIIAQFGEEFADKVEYKNVIAVDAKEEERVETNDKNKIGQVKRALIREIWDKTKKKVIFICESYKEKPLKQVDDPLKLSGFFPIPKPLIFYKRVSGLVPIAPYKAYEEQAKELNLVSARISKIVDMMKVRGFYDGTLSGLATLMTLNDGEFQPLDNVASFKNGDGAIPDAFWFMPIQELVAVLQQLYAAREAVKSIIYEVTGIADILRGASVASETATAQGIKDKWGSLRIKRWQKAVSVYARDCIRLMGELTAEHLKKAELAEMTLVQLPSDADRTLAQQQLQQIQVLMQQGQQQMQQMPPEQQQQVQQQIPQIQQKAQQLELAAKATTWEDIEKLFQNDLLRSYHIDIETNSTLDTDASEDKASISEFLNALAQFLNGIGPMVEKGAMKPEAANAILGSIARRFRFGDEIEEFLQIDGSMGGEQKAKEMEQQLQKVSKDNEQLNQQLKEQQLKAVKDEANKMAEIKIAKISQQAGEAVIMAKVELMLTKHDNQVQTLFHQHELNGSKMSVEILAGLHKDLLGQISELAKTAEQQQEPATEPLPA